MLVKVGTGFTVMVTGVEISNDLGLLILMYTNKDRGEAEVPAFITTTAEVIDMMEQEAAATDVARSAPVDAEHC